MTRISVITLAAILTGATVTGSGSQAAEQPDRSAPATVLGDIARFFGSDRYPPAALRAREQGRVVVRVELDARAFPSKCTTLTSSGSTVLDEQTCQIAMLNLQYAPARDSIGRAIPSQYSFAVRWVLPTMEEDEPIELVTTATPIGHVTAQYEVDKEGQATSCKRIEATPGAPDWCAGFKVGGVRFPPMTVRSKPSKAIVTVTTMVTADYPRP